MRLPALIFDFGNVVAHFDYHRACGPLAERLGMSAADLLQQVRTSGLSALVERYESGRLESEAFARSVCELAGLAGVAYPDFARAWSDIFWLNEEVARLVAHLRANGYRLVLGSNTNELHATHFRRQFPETLGCFDRLVLSYEVGHIKPSPGFYRACAEAAGVPARDCLFIDDLAENVAGARAAGMNGLLYRDYPTLLRDLRESQIELPGAEF